MIVAHKNALLPPHCPKCNAPVDRPPRKWTYYWHHPAIYLTILAGLLIYVIVALVVRQKGAVYFSLCPRHRTRRVLGLLIGWIGGLGGVVVAIAGAANQSAAIGILGIVIFIVGIVAALSARVLYPNRIDEHFVWLKGASPQYLDLLPPVPMPAYAPAGYPQQPH